jgi:drug/metabolite transporter (DMT)-like permease
MKSSWMLVAATLFALMGVLVKQASAHFSSPELVFYRSIFGLVAIWLGIVWQSRQVFAPLATQHLMTHFWRGLAGFIALVLFFYALAFAAGNCSHAQLHRALVSGGAIGSVATRAAWTRFFVCRVVWFCRHRAVA